jgi:hypothetical protein
MLDTTRRPGSRFTQHVLQVDAIIVHRDRRRQRLRHNYGRAAPDFCDTVRKAVDVTRGWVAERLNAPDLKSGDRASDPWVRIPPHPPLSSLKTDTYVVIYDLVHHLIRQPAPSAMTARVRPIVWGAISYLFLFGLIACEIAMEAMEAMARSIAVFLVVLIPLVRTAGFALQFPAGMREALSREESDQEGSRVLKLTFAGFSLAAYFVLVIEAVKPDTRADFSLPVYFTFVSFAAFMFAYLLDSHRFVRWQAELTQDLTETGRLALLASAVAILWETKLPISLQRAILIIGALGWIANFIVDWHLHWCYLAREPSWAFLRSKIVEEKANENLRSPSRID